MFCKSNRTDKTGWVAIGVLCMEKGVGIVLQNYTSKEMHVTEGEIINAKYELNGWYWCTRFSDGDGWVAKKY